MAKTFYAANKEGRGLEINQFGKDLRKTHIHFGDDNVIDYRSTASITFDNDNKERTTNSHEYFTEAQKRAAHRKEEVEDKGLVKGKGRLDKTSHHLLTNVKGTGTFRSPYVLYGSSGGGRTYNDKVKAVQGADLGSGWKEKMIEEEVAKGMTALNAPTELKGKAKMDITSFNVLTNGKKGVAVPLRSPYSHPRNAL